MRNPRVAALAGIVVVVLGSIAALIGPCVVTVYRGQNRAMARLWCREYHDAVMKWRAEYGAYPATLLEMEAPRDGGGPFVRIVEDPWGGDYRLEFAGPNIHVCSSGPDQTPDTEDDVCYIAKDE